MDYYKKKKLSNVGLLILLLIGIALQIVGHFTSGYKGLSIQAISLLVLVFVLFIYNRRFK